LFVKQIFLKLVVAGCALGLAVVVGCKAKVDTAAQANPEALQAAQQLPEGTNALAALERNDYENAMKALVAIKQEVTNPEQEAALAILKQHFKSKLMDAAPTDPKAAEALNTLRFMTQGR
jgi:hypothetical protein